MQRPTINRIFALACLWLVALAGYARAQTSKTPELYQQCARPLAEQPAQSAVITKQLAALKDRDAKPRRAAAGQLAKTCDARAVEPLLAALKDEDAGLRYAAVAALGQLGSDDAIDTLIELCNEPDPRLRTALALSLGSFVAHRARNATLNALVNTGGATVKEEADMRARCFGVLVVNQMVDVRFSRKALGFLFDFLDNPDPKLRQIAEATAGELKNTRNGLHELCGILKQHSLPDFRRKAAYWLGQWGQPEARAALAEASVGDQDPGVQGIAKEALAKLK